MTLNNNIKKVINIILILVILFWMFPYIWGLVTSFKTGIDSYSMPPTLLFKPSLSNYYNVFVQKNMFKYIFNSIIVALISTFFSMILGIPLAYMLARTRFKFNNALFIFVFLAYVLPPIVLSIPLYILGAKLALLDNFILIIITHVSFCLSFTIWMLRGFFEEIPVEVEESARIDGCNYLNTLIRVVLPMIRSGVIATIIFCIILSWNDFMYALILTGVNTRTLPVQAAQFLSPHGMFWGEMCAAGTTAVIPVFAFSLFFQKYIVRGLSAGAIK